MPWCFFGASLANGRHWVKRKSIDICWQNVESRALSFVCWRNGGLLIWLLRFVVLSTLRIDEGCHTKTADAFPSIMLKLARNRCNPVKIWSLQIFHNFFAKWVLAHAERPRNNPWNVLIGYVSMSVDVNILAQRCNIFTSSFRISQQKRQKF